MRVLHAVLTLAAVAALGSCASDRIVGRRLLARVVLDSHAEPGRVKLLWSVTSPSDCFGPDCPPPKTPIAGIAVQLSTLGPSIGFRTLFRREGAEPDSGVVGDLTDGKLYWFRAVGLDAVGRHLVESMSVMTMPGPPSVPVRSIPIEISGSFDWSPDGDSIAYVRARPFVRADLAIMDLATGSARTLASYDWDAWAGDAAWSPDGATVAFTHTPTLTSAGLDYRIRCADLKSGNVAPNSPGRVDFDPAWGGGDWLYFCRGTPGTPNIAEIWRVKPGSPATLEAVTQDPSVRKYGPSVRPGDDLVVYEGRAVEANTFASGIYAVDPDVHVPVHLTPGSRYEDAFPFWDPDGRHVTFVSNRCGHNEVWSLDYATGALRQVTRGAQGSERILARRTPDGRALAVLEGKRGGWSAWGDLVFYDAGALLP